MENYNSLIKYLLDKRCILSKKQSRVFMVKRIEFIDLAKGICILMVILGHVGVPIEILGLKVVRMPLYFILSGLFYKDYGGLRNLIIKKINKLLIPFVFFYSVSYVLFYLIAWIMPNLKYTAATGILDVFFQDHYYNGPIWFLLALFWCNLFCYFIHFVTKKVIFRILGILIMGGIGCWLGKMHIFLPCKLDSALTAMPFFYFGYMLKSTSLLYSNKFDRYWFLCILGLWGGACVGEIVFDTPIFKFSHNDVLGNPFYIYPLSIIEVLSLMLLCKKIKNLPFISYFGRYSIIPLCLHILIYRPIVLFVNLLGVEKGEHIIESLIVIFLCWIAIPICIRFLPYVTAQKDLILVDKE